MVFLIDPLFLMRHKAKVGRTPNNNIAQVPEAYLNIDKNTFGNPREKIMGGNKTKNTYRGLFFLLSDLSAKKLAKLIEIVNWDVMIEKKEKQLIKIEIKIGAFVKSLVINSSEEVFCKAFSELINPKITKFQIK